MGTRKHRTIETDIFGYDVREGGINSKKKGDKNERQATKWLYLWTGEDFARTPSSGGLRWKNNPSVCGDVVCQNVDFNFPFSVETKHLKTVAYDTILRSNSKIFTIWAQAWEDASRAKKTPMLMLRSNGMPVGEYYIVFSAAILHPIVTNIDALFTGYNSEWGHLKGYNSKDVLEKLPFKNFVI